jgi:hypothetical protein
MCGNAQMIGMMVAIDAVEHLHAHAKEARGLPFVDAGLHQPRSCRVAQRVGRDIPRKLRKPDRGLEGSLDGLHPLAVPLDKVFMNDALGDPSAQMSE